MAHSVYQNQASPLSTAMPPLFMLILPAPIGTGPESHPSFQSLLAHIRTEGRELAVQSKVIAASDEDTRGLVQLLLRDVPRRVPSV